jgi:hypothetical protein
MQTTPCTIYRSGAAAELPSKPHLLSHNKSVELAQARQILCALQLHVLPLGIGCLKLLGKLLRTLAKH